MSTKVYTIHYNMKTRDGQVVDTSLGGEPLEFVEGSGQVVKGIEKALQGREPGQVLEVTIPPELGYGERRDDLVEVLPIEAFEDVELTPGKVLQTNENGKIRVVKVIEVTQGGVKVDSNHPLAGFNLYFDLELIAVRDANTTEQSELRSIH